MNQTYGEHLSFPFHVGDDGRMARATNLDDHVREELIQLLLTSQGERPFLPEFGGGVRRLVFENADPATEGVTKATLTQAITRWLGHRVTLVDLLVSIRNETIEVSITYRIAGSEETRVMTFQGSGERP